MLARYLIGPLVASAMLAAAPAASTVMQATFTGKITTVYYADNTFGTASLTGLTYQAVWTFDPSVGTAYAPYVGCPGCFDQMTDGVSPNITIRKLTITINGITDVINFLNPAYAQSRIEHINNPYAPNSSVYMNGTAGEYVPSPVGPPYTAYSYFSGGSSYSGSGAISADWTEPWAPGAGGSGGSGFLKQVQNAGRGYDQAYNFSGSVLSASISAAPEPASWLLMIVGLGAGGVALRRQRQISASA